MSALEWLWALSFLSVSVQLFIVQRRSRKYRESIHVLLSDEGHVEGEADAIVDELLRVSSQMGMQQPTLQQFGHALSRQEAFRKAVAHELLHEQYVKTHGRQA